MIGLFDRDVFLKLCCCNLWSEALAALDITDPYRLVSTSSDRSNRRSISRMLPDLDTEEICSRVQAILKDVPVLPDEFVDGLPATEGYQVLADVENINDGEHILGAILINQPDGKILISGDKRFVAAVREQRPDQWQTMGPAVISFEMCMLAIESAYGFEYVLERVHPVCHCDGTLKLAIGHEPQAAKFREAMSSFNPCKA